MTLTAHRSDPELIRSAFGRFPSGVVALAADTGGDPAVLVASSFTVGVSLDPPLVLFAVRNESSTWPRMRGSRRIGVSLLSADQAELCRRLAGRDWTARFGEEPIERTPEGALLFAGSPLWLDCSVFGEIPAGDHRVVLLEVHQFWQDNALDPLIFHGSAFRRLEAA
ncbi:flavin reductase family protein [Paractinoplanes brasiliensis]|uniref:Flavin reductase (DIM6/NTAB) family NADH-FMN oxidoreductase RutF n=1 Tax=Paractinoplanes brasiliensis TaxID=52695 RepID=A0A4V6PST7_9ACTN|nr:flavin reductase family protein [Actinoplanes brasiliensis]TDO36828.1 flavin reductase (DIM6/NTAB) family NADH-FMN oxidoreductase RutF [Actinoplanes brasiliensis]GID30345.1 putative oxidoreductase [Actinoplanes brasiliensis]